MVSPPILFIFLVLAAFLPACGIFPLEDGAGGNDPSLSSERVREVGGNPSPGARDIYSIADLKNLCVDPGECTPSYNLLPSSFIRTSHPLDPDICNFDSDPNATSTFVLNRTASSVNGLDLFLSKEDLFFIAWISVRLQINPYFLMAVMAAESRGNCSAVSSAHGEGCFQITNTFGQGQLNESYPDRVRSWFWSDRSGSYYPDAIFVNEDAYFGETPPSEQFRVTLDPTAQFIAGVEVSSVVNFPFGVTASGLYFHWQHYLLYTNYPDLRLTVSDLFQQEDQKALWQAAAYNGGAFGAASALRNAGGDFLSQMRPETQTYAPTVVDYCTEFQRGPFTYSAEYEVDDVEWIVDLLSDTYPKNFVDWGEVKNDLRQVFFEDGTQRLSLVDDIKAVIYVISTHLPQLAPEWPEADSID